MLPTPVPDLSLFDTVHLRTGTQQYSAFNVYCGRVAKLITVVVLNEAAANTAAAERERQVRPPCAAVLAVHERPRGRDSPKWFGAHTRVRIGDGGHPCGAAADAARPDRFSDHQGADTHDDARVPLALSRPRPLYLCRPAKFSGTLTHALSCSHRVPGLPVHKMRAAR
jgi:hypothetical protein